MLKNSINFIEKMVLGTAQLGMDYGIANRTGKPSKKEVFEILEFAWDKGITRLDTAPVYGSESLIGEFVRANGINDQIKLITKIPPIDGDSSYEKFIKNQVERSYNNLGAPIDVLFFHNPNDALLLGEDPKFFRKLKNDNAISSYGVSIYDEEDIIKHSNYEFKMCLQFPYNFLDQRFSKINVPFSKKYARSIFLQGVLASKGKLKNNAPKELIKLHAEYHAVLSKSDIDPLAFAMQFAFQNNEIDFFLFGVDSKTQLEQLIDIKLNFEFSEKLMRSILNRANTKLIDPRKWD